MPSRPRTFFLWAVLLAGCTPLKDGNERRIVVRGAFDAGSVAASKDGITLRGQLSWHGHVGGSLGGITLRAVLLPPPR